MEDGSFSKAAASRLTVLESEQSRLEAQIKALKRKRPTLSPNRIEFFLESMSQRTGELPQDYLNRIIKIFVSRVDLSNEDLKIKRRPYLTVQPSIPPQIKNEQSN